jgi:hypothetical protein
MSNTELPYKLTANDRFDGDFDSLPLRSHFACGPVPVWPTAEEFQRAGMAADRSPEHRWFCEAMRFRRNAGYGVSSLGPAALKIIATAVARALHRKSHR